MADKPTLTPQVQMLANQIANSMLSLRGAHTSSLDSKHTKAWDDYGYKERLEFSDYMAMSERFGIAAAALTVPPEICFRTNPEIKEGEPEEFEGREERTPWEKDLNKLFKRLKMFRKIKMIDEYQRVGHYAGFAIQIKSSQKSQTEWSAPLKNINADQIVKIIPLYECQLEPISYEEDSRSIRYGQPTMYEMNQRDPSDLSNDNSYAPKQITIHHSRVIIFAEGADNDDINGRPALKRVFNDLITMEKIIGAGGEGYWKNAAQKTVYSNRSKDGGMPTKPEMEAFDDAIQDFVTGLDKHLLTGDFDAKTLTAALADPSGHFQIALNSCSAGVGIAAKLLIGAQEGKLASEQDGVFTLSNMQSRRESWGTQMFECVLDWLIEHGAIKNVEYTVEWDDLLAPSDSDKFELGDKLAKVITELETKTGYSPIDPSEVAKIMGYKPAEIEVEEDDPEGDEDKEELQ